MFNALTQAFRLDGLEIKQLIATSLRIVGVLLGATLVFIVLFFFVASLDVPILHS